MQLQALGWASARSSRASYARTSASIRPAAIGVRVETASVCSRTDEPVDRSVRRPAQRRRQDFVTGLRVYRGSRVRSPPVPVVVSVYQRGSLLDGLAMYLSCDTKKFHDNESTHILHNFWTSTHRREVSLPSPLAAPLVPEVAMPYSDMWQDCQITFPHTRPCYAKSSYRSVDPTRPFMETPTRSTTCQMDRPTPPR